MESKKEGGGEMNIFTCSIICLTVFKRTTPVGFSEPASLGSVSARVIQVCHGFNDFSEGHQIWSDSVKKRAMNDLLAA